MQPQYCRMRVDDSLMPRLHRLEVKPNHPLDRMTRSAVVPSFCAERPWRAPRHRSACR
jgi:hypothetical protein